MVSCVAPTPPLHEKLGDDHEMARDRFANAKWYLNVKHVNFKANDLKLFEAFRNQVEVFRELRCYSEHSGIKRETTRKQTKAKHPILRIVRVAKGLNYPAGS